MINRDLVKSGSTDEPNARKDGKKGRERRKHKHTTGPPALRFF